MKLAYSSEAVHDLIRLRHFLAEKDPAAAARIASELITRVEQLLVFPEMGRPVMHSPEPGAVRDFVFGAYVVRYATHASMVAILRIWHQLEQARSHD